MKRRKSYPPFEKVGGVYLDNEIKKLVIITKDVLINQLHRDCPKIAESFDDVLAEEIVDISALIASVSTLIFPHILGRDLTSKSSRETCARLLNTAMTTLIGCIYLARGGFRIQYATLSRSVVETICTVLYLMVSEGALRDFHAGKLKSTRAISVAKNVIPVFGEIWGLLSNHFVHINTTHSTFEPLTIYKKLDEDLSFIRHSAKSLAWLLLVATEVTFIEDIEHPQYWKLVRKLDGNTEVAFQPSDETRKWMAEFLEMETT